MADRQIICSECEILEAELACLPTAELEIKYKTKITLIQIPLS